MTTLDEVLFDNLVRVAEAKLLVDLVRDHGPEPLVVLFRLWHRRDDVGRRTTELPPGASAAHERLLTAATEQGLDLMAGVLVSEPSRFLVR
jgi:hypothetical protein